jgi:hypothetical protein
MAIVDFKKAIRPYAIVTDNAGTYLYLHRSYNWKELTLIAVVILLAIALWPSSSPSITIYVRAVILILLAMMIPMHIWSELRTPTTIDIQRGFLKFEYRQFFGGRSDKIISSSEIKGIRPDTRLQGKRGISPVVHFYLLNNTYQTITFMPRSWGPGLVKQSAEVIAGRFSAILGICTLSHPEIEQ